MGFADLSESPANLDMDRAVPPLLVPGLQCHTAPQQVCAPDEPEHFWEGPVKPIQEKRLLPNQTEHVGF